MLIVLTLFVIFLILLINEVISHKFTKNKEIKRKLMHIIIGVLTAFWPFYLSFMDIKLLALAYLIVVVLSKRFNIFKAIHNVKRKSYGEELFAISVGLLAFLTNNKWIFAVAILEMAIADGLAAIIGSKYGKSTSYHLLRQTKSFLGNLSFFITSLVILLLVNQFSTLKLGIIQIVLVSVVTTIIEGISFFGLDDLFVPIVVFLMINH
jgi:dolichol kinase